MTPTVGGGNGRWCTTAGCGNDLNPGCPDNLKVVDGGNVVACKSSCVVTNSDLDCCRGPNGQPDTCHPSPSCSYFKSNCPGAYCYAYDDGTSTFTCRDTDYNIVFG